MPMPAPPVGQNIYPQQNIYQGPPYAPPGAAANYPASHAGYHQQNYHPAQNYQYRPPGPPPAGGYYPGNHPGYGQHPGQPGQQ